MKKIVQVALVVIAMLLLLATIAALSVTPAHAAETAPSAYQSLQPFEHFGKGEGEGVAYLYKSRTKADFIAILRDKKLAKKEMRVKCEVLVRQMMEGHADLPFEGCEGTAKAIEGDDFTVVACRDEMFKQNNFLTVTNADGSAFGVWHRKCLPNEKVLVYKDQLLLSTTCLNVAVPVAPPKALLVPLTPIPLKAPPVATGACPSGYLLVANAWNLSSMPQRLRDTAMKLVSEAEERDSENASKMESYKPSAFSRTLGGQLRREVKTRADVNTRILVNLRDPVSFKVVQSLGAMEMVSGIGKMSLTKDQVAMVVETIWPNGFVSPAISGAERRIELFFPEWGDWCEMNVHGAKP